MRMNKEESSSYLKYYNNLAIALISIALISIIAILGIIPFLGIVQTIAIYFVMKNKSNIARLPEFEGQKSLSQLVEIWFIIIVASLFLSIYQLASDPNYLLSESYTILDFVALALTIGWIVLSIMIYLRCQKNIKILKALSSSDTIENSD